MTTYTTLIYNIPNSSTLDRPILAGLGSSTATAVMDVGTTVSSTEGGRKFMYVCYDCSGVAAICGAPCVFSNCTAQLVVTSDTSDTNTEGAFAGVFCSDQANANKCWLWIQTHGEVTGAHCESDVAAGDSLFVGQNNCFDDVEGQFDSIGSSVYNIVAVAKTADTTSKADIVILR